MIMYIVIILICSSALVIGNAFFASPELTLGFNIFGVCISVIAVIGVDGVIAWVCHKLQGTLITPDYRYFKVSDKEKKRLERFGVKRFKAFLPDLGTLVKFPKGTVANPKSKEYIYRYILESCSGEINHVLSMFLGFVIIFMFPLRYVLCFGIPVGIVNLILNFLPVMSLRYNRYRLTKIYNRLLIKEERQKETIFDDGVVVQE